WVHRSTRGWSYGSSVMDPRTGEIIKGHVTLGSLRVRQDFLIAEGLLAPYEDGKPANPEMLKMALSRLRQLAAHEVGHTLGLSHAYSSSSENLSSVMDYPHPMVTVQNGQVDLSRPYDDKIGAFDKVAINWGYREFAKGTDEQTALDNIIHESLKNGMTFLSDQDGRPAGGAHPYTHLWDNGKDAADEVHRIMEVRSVVLKNFGERNIRTGAPMATLEEVLVPMYFLHRYQVEAASKIVGGLNYRYALRGDGQPVTEFLDPAVQEKALTELLSTTSASALQLPESLLKNIPPRPLGYTRHRELAKIRTELTFDPITLAETAADLTYSMLLHPARMNRLVE
ncbi:MAG: zinc-dependent metalloprotease, partial [Bacteroidota bacterium]